MSVRQQSGSALVMAVFFTALLGSLGIALLFLGTTNLEQSRVQLDVKKTFFLAESGIEHGRRTLQDTGGGGDLSALLVDAAGDNGILDFDATTLVALSDSDGEFSGLGGYDDDVPLKAAASLGEGYFAAFLSNDPLDGRQNLTDSNSRVLLTGVGVGPNDSFRLVEAIVEPDILMPPIPPAAVTLLGSSPSFAGGTSNSERYHGEDCYLLGGGQPGLEVGVVGATTDAAEGQVEDGMGGPAHKYSSGDWFGLATGINLLDPTEALVADTGTMDPSWNDCGYLQQLLDKLRDYSTHYCSGDDCELPDGLTDEDIVFVDGDLGIGAEKAGAGILVVTGKLTFNGHSIWTGLVLVIGEGHMARAGGGNGYLSGATIVGDIAGPNGSYGDADDCTPVADPVEEGEEEADDDTDPFGNSTYEVHGGGNSDVDFCTRFQSNGPRGYRIVDFRQR